MPIFHFQCPGCGFRLRKILGYIDENQVICPGCGQGANRVPSAPSTTVKEVLDNGLMIRPVERIADAERIFRERSKTSEQVKELY